MKSGIKRIHFLDELRGFAILCMVVHHAFYDIGFVLGYDFGYKIFNFLCIFQPLFWAAFIITSGICSRLSKNTVRRGLIVLAGGLAVTLVTAVIMPAIGITGAEIYFGILSCLGCCMIITGLLMPAVEKINAKGGMAVCAVVFFFTYSVSDKSLLFGLIKLPDFLYSSNIFAPLGFYGESFFSADYFPLIPWLFMFLFGAFLGGYAKKGMFPAALYKSRSKFLQKIGKNSFWIYLLHQPALYAIMYIISFIKLIFA
ncbi:MAG: DUF1624 domain-containing protein [Clostridiales bacterium]|nr:DUF1624 domain-containing protein [Clostridiales bacterium]